MSIHVVVPSRNPKNLEVCLGALMERERGTCVAYVDDMDGEYFGAKYAFTDTFNHLHTHRVPGIKPFIFGRNVNLGINEHANHTADRLPGVFILNDDALLKTPGGFSRMAEVSEEHPECGVISAAIDGGAVNPEQMNRLGEPVLTYTAQVVAFIAVYIPLRTIQTVGLLDERFGPEGYGYEDNDYCHRVRLAGLKVGIWHGTVVEHKSLPSTFRADPNINARMAINKRLFEEKWNVRVR